MLPLGRYRAGEGGGLSFVGIPRPKELPPVYCYMLSRGIRHRQAAALGRCSVLELELAHIVLSRASTSSKTK